LEGNRATANLVTVGPRETFIVMFDVSVYARNGGHLNFANTMSPAPDFFTDENGAQVASIIATGPEVEPLATPGSLTLSPEAGASAVGTVHSVTALAKDASGTPTADAVVLFAITSGPNAEVSGLVVTDSDGEATYTYTDTAGIDGTDSIEAESGQLLSNVVSKSWTTPGELDHIAINPTNAKIPTDGSRAYSAEAFDIFGNSRGDVTSATTFTIADGTCNGATCMATTPGAHTVTGLHESLTATATLTVVPGLIFFDDFE